MSPEWLKVANAARYLGVQPHTIYRLIEQGKLRAEGRSTTVLRANGTLAEGKAETKGERQRPPGVYPCRRSEAGGTTHLTTFGLLVRSLKWTPPRASLKTAALVGKGSPASKPGSRRTAHCV